MILVSRPICFVGHIHLLQNYLLLKIYKENLIIIMQLILLIFFFYLKISLIIFLFLTDTFFIPFK